MKKNSLLCAIILGIMYKPQNKLNTQNKTFCFRFT